MKDETSLQENNSSSQQKTYCGTNTGQHINQEIMKVKNKSNKLIKDQPNPDEKFKIFQIFSKSLNMHKIP